MPAQITWFLTIILVATLPPINAADDLVIDIGSRRELFVDHYLVEQLDQVRLTLNRPHDEGPVLHFDNPWEGPFCGYCTVIKDGELFRLYYRGRPEAGADGDEGEVYCYAESADGIHWTKPDLNRFEIGSYRKNNIVLANAAPVTHNFCPVLDTRPGVPADERFKAIGGTMTSGLVVWKSANGIDWKKLRDEPVLTKQMVPFPYMFDSQNLAFWSPAEEKYLCYFRVFKDGIRRICRTTSVDFVHWSAPQLMEYRHNGQPAPIEHLYTNQTHPYYRAPHLYLSIAARFMPGRQVLTDRQAKEIGVSPRYFKDTSDAILMTTRGGAVYDRTFLSSFVRPGIGAHNWVSRTNYPALNVVQTGAAEMSLYVNQDYAQPTAHLRRYSMRLDGFASARAEYAGGELRTRPFTFSGSQLTINFATSAAGGIRVELLAADLDEPIPGFKLADCVEQIGNEVARVVTWKKGTDVSELAGKPIRMRLSMKDADLFSFQFVP
jgi:hypothetical protein